MDKSIQISEIADFLNVDYHGKNYLISQVNSLNKIQDGSLVFSKNRVLDINLNYKSLVLCPIGFDYLENAVYTVIKVKNPRLAFAKVVNEFFIENNNVIDSSSYIDERCQIGENVAIGKNTILKHNVVIFDNTIIGNNCYIKSGSIIGEDGFGFDFKEDKTPVRIPHIGNVIIKNNVEIGANVVISRGTLESTIIEDDVKIDDQVFIAHNCIIGKKTIIVACAELSGSVTIGSDCWIGPNSSIIQKVTIGNNVVIGIGSIVTKDIPSKAKIMGFRGLELKKLIKLQKRIGFGE